MIHSKTSSFATAMNHTGNGSRHFSINKIDAPLDNVMTRTSGKG